MTDPTTAGGARLEIPVPLRWSDLDAYGHVNNAGMLTLLEEARIVAFWRHPGAQDLCPTAVLDAGPGAPTTTLIAHTEIEYLLPIPYLREGVVVHLWVSRLGGASAEVSYEVRDRSGQGLFTRAMTTIVLVDPATGRPRRISAEERAAWEPYLGPPVAFRRR